MASFLLMSEKCLFFTRLMVKRSNFSYFLNLNEDCQVFSRFNFRLGNISNFTYCLLIFYRNLIIFIRSYTELYKKCHFWSRVIIPPGPEPRKKIQFTRQKILELYPYSYKCPESVCEKLIAMCWNGTLKWG